VTGTPEIQDFCYNLWGKLSRVASGDWLLPDKTCFPIGIMGVLPYVK
jgi:hypothetical protein